MLRRRYGLACRFRSQLVENLPQCPDAGAEWAMIALHDIVKLVRKLGGLFVGKLYGLHGPGRGEGMDAKRGRSAAPL
jgi:hypothetical protein